MSKPDTPKTPDPPQPEAPAAKLIQPLEDSPMTAVRRKTQMRRYLTAAPDAATNTSGVGVQL
ncbi:hypothetical protein [Burkholderia oklahomensis]|uniref:hypothetical protein n=1 Tax=Burkholderia oklahomensis TaxID=342113 RepID=UPI0003107BAE|nr:hypothetical protein [Burkholderia oklahomensis]QPS39528.1 hypothetical protein I6G57_27195 [Burkholderia oklahomensis]